MFPMPVLPNNGTFSTNQMSANQNKLLLKPFREALYDFDRDRLASVMKRVFDDRAEIRLAFPFENLSGPDELLERGFVALANAMPDMERRDTILIAGDSQQE